MFHERRQRDENAAFSRDGLSTAQKYSLNEVEHHGYQAVFVRDIDAQSMVVATQGNRVLTIDIYGGVNTAPDIELRK